MKIKLKKATKPAAKPKQAAAAASSNWLKLKGAVSAPKGVGKKRKHAEIASQQWPAQEEQEQEEPWTEQNSSVLWEDAEQYVAMDCEMVSFTLV